MGRPVCVCASAQSILRNEAKLDTHQTNTAVPDNPITLMYMDIHAWEPLLDFSLSAPLGAAEHKDLHITFCYHPPLAFFWAFCTISGVRLRNAWMREEKIEREKQKQFYWKQLKQCYYRFIISGDLEVRRVSLKSLCRILRRSENKEKIIKTLMHKNLR